MTDWLNRIHNKSCEDMSEIPDGSIHCVVTSPPYFALRDYGMPGQIGLEKTLDEYIERLVVVLRGVRRVLRDDGIAWLNLGDSYATRPRGTDNGWDKSRLTNPARVQKAQSLALRRGKIGASDGIKEKELMFVPHRVAMALQADGWYVRCDVVWAKPNPMPESTDDRPTRSHEYVFLLVKSGTRKFWTHRDGRAGVRTKPPADYRWIDRENSDELNGRIVETRTPPDLWQDMLFLNPLTANEEPRWQRINLWTGHDYFYDFDAVAEPLQSGPSDLRKMIEQRPRIGGKTLEAEDPAYKANASTNIGQKRGVGGNGGVRNRRSVWTISTVPYKGAHFAVFPPELATICIKAGTSPGGCCEQCGAPHYRIVDVKRGPRDDAGRTHSTEDQRLGKTPVPERGWESNRRTIGFAPTCKCQGGGTVPCRVLDPFMGSGTVMEVAFSLQCDAVGYELNAEYIDLANRRPGIVERRNYEAVMRGESVAVTSTETPLIDAPLFESSEGAA